MDIMTLWLDGSISTIDGYGSSGNQKNSKAPSKKKGGAGTAAKKSAKSSGKKANAKSTTKAAAGKKKLDVKHAKLVRDSFTIPEDELQLLMDAKKKCLKAGVNIKKSELIRIGISLVYGLGLSRLKKEKRALQPIKTGRPRKLKPA
jgi:hypothetical protein